MSSGRTIRVGVQIEEIISVLNFLQISGPSNKTPMRYRLGNTVATRT
jgi:hypothetical protein